MEEEAAEKELASHFVFAVAKNNGQHCLTFNYVP